MDTEDLCDEEILQECDSDDEELHFSGDEGDGASGRGRDRDVGIAPSQTLTPDMLSKKMFELINEVNAVFQMPSQHVRILLTTCKWDKEKLLERFYAGDQVALFAQAHLVHPHKKPPAMSTMMPARLRTTSTSRCGAAASPGHEYICEVCMLSYPQPAMAGLECGHLFCHECWDNYLRVMVVCEGRAQTIACPATACDIVVDEATVLELLRQPEAKQKYQHLITQSFVLDNPNLVWCPATGCPNALLANKQDYYPVRCDCGYAFCFRCGREPHLPILCDYLRRWMKKCDDDSETSNWIHCNTKECYKCHATIEKNGGCNHMICTTCKAEFCWTCLGPWEPHGSSWYHCNRFNETDAQSARSTQARSRAALERYLFYFNRYVNHLSSSKMEHKLYDMAHQKMCELQQLNMSWIEAQFLKKAVDILCRCRQTLRYTYAFAYYLLKNNHTLIFEENQRDLEMATETLSEYLERDISHSTISDMKIFVQDKSKYCESRCRALLEHVFEGYDLDLWEFTKEQ